ncbi:uncharacterized protein LOC131017343 [Salvia miltiorrhiza]|uniref:uncharacterized protein LOC131017343 n=1 Tax=Salvia miltiorrhiza TaxID=226208 RepID=UPI0025ACF88B|nr:uncharacterized protein LOC131017343 [Salvia miltiorrhiza]
MLSLFSLIFLNVLALAVIIIIAVVYSFSLIFLIVLALAVIIIVAVVSMLLRWQKTVSSGEDNGAVVSEEFLNERNLKCPEKPKEPEKPKAPEKPSPPCAPPKAWFGDIDDEPTQMEYDTANLWRLRDRTSRPQG